MDTQLTRMTYADLDNITRLEPFQWCSGGVQPEFDLRSRDRQRRWIQILPFIGNNDSKRLG